MVGQSAIPSDATQPTDDRRFANPAQLPDRKRWPVRCLASPRVPCSPTKLACGRVWMILHSDWKVSALGFFRFGAGGQQGTGRHWVMEGWVLLMLLLFPQSADLVVRKSQESDHRNGNAGAAQ